MTPATQQLKQKKIPFDVLQYDHDVNATSFGLEAVEKLSLNAQQVFKTLVVCCDTDQLAVAIVPVNLKLNLKAIAKVLKVKKVKMADAKRVEATTGYVLGGVSPLGQKKRLPTVIDSSAETLELMYVSGGKRGLEIALAPKDLKTLSQASFAVIST
ncbi:Cys-tRNA(Pro) deacylase [Colwellia sp. 4_MG-2023]|uniref:Cys-tRNA(Pro) deacylase n=1 Tax=unclassified Colwellia TaxID=196834 RepID=UPI001C0858A1|nr:MULTISPECIES: Cys-tRNA(Pro) deacylase [unclassified Colwellia]MBU2924747.1 Cys-tRNA(Pro) deacylase [Colwellia sp. C2M11]MDO6507099.1 Cys-tRNA(Pro) deacylase [Colwellia sp. 5_MG-2023]MDO6555855.1 Cys-tRNA(Pro) deacylase [Colwellia sp. 4_MG-2023]MDO6653584.1 Cys-tRNA(Pro) deacylase [Colwellia sp. 3_MG-2023]MDO6666315.1 Cys-tRNA(Pro) deacylase [Colwellia sp. 2_MG-2023]